MDALDRFGPELTWFRLGDRDLATHLYRTRRLDEGAPLSAVTARSPPPGASGVRLLPDDRRPGGDPGRGGRRGRDRVPGLLRPPPPRRARPGGAVRGGGGGPARAGGARRAGRAPTGSSSARPTPSCRSTPSWPCPASGRRSSARRDDVVAVSPIVAGAALKGPAARLLADLGHDVSVVGVARLYAPLASVLVVDEADALAGGGGGGRGHPLRGGPRRHAGPARGDGPGRHRARRLSGAMAGLEIIPVEGVPEVRPGDVLADLLVAAVSSSSVGLVRGRRRGRRHPEGGVQGGGADGARSTTTTVHGPGRGGGGGGGAGAAPAGRPGDHRDQGRVRVRQLRRRPVERPRRLRHAPARRRRPLRPPHPRRPAGPDRAWRWR